jgi:hypothetical protein
MAGRGDQRTGRGRQGALLGLVLLNALILTTALTALPAIRAPHHLERGQSLALTTARPDVAPAPVPTWAPTLPAATAVAPPPTAPTPPAPRLTRKQVSDAALAMIKYPWRELGVHISFLGPRAGYFGRTFPQAGRIEMYVRPDENPTRLAYMLAHEIGHMADWRWNTPARRQAWKTGRHLPPSMSWFGNAFAGGDDLGTPAGDYAETFALWQVGPLDYKSRLGPPPTPEQLAPLVPLFNR